MSHRFYNGGDKIDERFPFSLPEGADIHVIGHWSFTAPRKSWVTVPRELTVRDVNIAVQFGSDVRRRYGIRGVVLLDPRHDPTTEDPERPLQYYPVAPTEELVVARADKLWDNYVEEICTKHMNAARRSMAAGLPPSPAEGFTLHALKIKGYRDPAQDFLHSMKQGQQGAVPGGLAPEVAGILSQMQADRQMMMSILLAVAPGKPVDPALLKAAIAPSPNGDPAPMPKAEVPENAGQLQVEGQAQTSLEQRINRKSVEYETLNSKPADKKGRAAAAAKEL